MWFMNITVSNKGLISIPKEIRDRLGIREGTKLKLYEAEGRIVLEKDTADWRSLRGLAAGSDLLRDHLKERKIELQREALHLQ